jgi:beta-glucuronidase
MHEGRPAGDRALALGLLSALALFCAPAAAGPLAHVSGRTTLSLDGEWQSIVDPYDSGRINYRGRVDPNGFFKDAGPRSPSDRVEYDFDASGALTVPGDWNSQRPELFLYEGPVWYRRLFELDPDPEKRYQLHFGAVNRIARVYLNGEPVGEHVGGFTPFAFEVTGRLMAGSNTLVVQADNSRHRDAIPTLMTDWWNYGGITRPVHLVELPETFVEDYSLALAPGSRTAPSFGASSGQGQVVEGWVRLDGPDLEQEVVIRLRPRGGGETGASHVVRTDRQGLAAVRFEADLELWRPEDSHLYEVEIAAETDRVVDEIGFRSIEVRGGEILLNGDPIFLRGISAHEEAPFRGGRAHSAEDARTLLGWVKELGGNFIRLAHYPHNEAMVREADRMGVLVWSEIPVYWTISWGNARTLASAKQQLTEMIERDRNRAAVILWSVANETPVSGARTAFLVDLVETARRLDPSRLVTAALEAHYEGEGTLVIDDPLGEHLDVIAANEYLGWYDGLPEKCDRISWRTPYGKPLIMSEFGGGALARHHGGPLDRWTEEYQESVYEHQIAMLKRIPFLRGTSPWILMDFRSPRRPLPEIQDFWNRKGLLSEGGVRKKAFYTLQAWYRDLAEEGR